MGISTKKCVDNISYVLRFHIEYKRFWIRLFTFHNDIDNIAVINISESINIDFPSETKIYLMRMAESTLATYISNVCLPIHCMMGVWNKLFLSIILLAIWIHNNMQNEENM